MKGIKPNFIIEDIEEEQITITLRTYELIFKNFKVRVQKRYEFNSQFGESEEEINIQESEKDLSKKDEEIIKNFIEEQENEKEN